MSLLFADTYYFLGLLNSHDAAHAKCLEFSQQQNPPLISTAWVFTELADGLGRSQQRHIVAKFLRAFEANDRNIFVLNSDDWFRRGLQLYSDRPDKNWSLTDCISFEVMQAHYVREALTGDHHFEQAGFIPLLV